MLRSRLVLAIVVLTCAACNQTDAYRPRCQPGSHHVGALGADVLNCT